MSLPVVFSPAALADVESAFAWYELQASGLGAEFLRRVKLMELNISREPLLYPVVKAPLRRATLRKFPYALFYLAAPDRVDVLGCFHHRRDPNIWPSRIPSA